MTGVYFCWQELPGGDGEGRKLKVDKLTLLEGGLCKARC